MAVQIQLRRDTAADWTSTNPTLADGEAGFETDTGKIKIGDGVTAWNSLAYRFESSAGLTYLGTWNASTNTPTIVSGTGTSGDYYVVSTAGTTSIDGINDWAISDWIIFNGTAWQKIDNSEAPETDPVFSASDAAGITAADISNWDDAYSWGDHALAGYLTSESDPVFSASAAAGITGTQITNWDTAYSWGNHASAGYAVLANFGRNHEISGSTINFSRNWRLPVRLASTANVPGTLSGSGVGATITRASNGKLTLDGVDAQTGDRVLLKDQTLPARNGIWVVTQPGEDGVSPYIITRATDFDGNAATGEVRFGDIVYVLNGNTLSGTFFYVTTTGTITVDTTSIAFQGNGSSNVTAFGSANRIAYFSATDTLTSDANYVLNATNGWFGIGATPSTANPIRFRKDHTDLAATNNGVIVDHTHTQTAANAFSLRGVTSTITLANGANNNTSPINNGGLNIYSGTATVTGSGTTTALNGTAIEIANTGSGTVTNAIGFQQRAFTNSGGGAITNSYGFYGADQTVGTTRASFYSAMTAGSGKYAFYGETAVSLFGGQIQGPAGSDAAPAFSYSAATNTGMWFPSTSQINLTTGGVTRVQVFNSTTRFQDGSVAAPGIGFTGDADTGFARTAANTVVVSTGNFAAATFTRATTTLANDTATVFSVGGESARITSSGLQMADARDIVLQTTTGTKIGTATSQKLSLWNATPDVQPTTAITGASYTHNSSTAVHTDDTFDGYRLDQVVSALRRVGILA